jgi:serine/threonine protein kinase
MSNGRIAMSVVPGKQLMDMSSTRKIGNTTAGDAYWAARASLHRLGVAHNDMHPGNLLIDKTGKGRWVDMGLAQDSPRAALAEALGVMRRPPKSEEVGRGDWQGRNWGGETGLDNFTIRSNAPVNLRTMQSNHETKVLPFLRSKGLDNDEIGEVMTLGIRAKPSQYTTGGFAKLSDADALQAINLLYTGVK